ncbi:pH nine-sensitive protein 1 [Rhizina undulata]
MAYQPPPGPTPHGAANDYYNSSSGYIPPQQPYYGQQYPPPPPLEMNQLLPPPQYPPQGRAPAPNEQDNTFESKFSISQPRWNDLWAAILFIINLFGFVVVSGISLHGYAGSKNVQGGGIYNNRNDFGLSTNTIILFGFVLAVAFVVSGGYFIAARTYTKQLIWTTGILNVVIGIGTVIYYFIRHYYSAAVIFAIFALFYAFCFYSWRSRIPFAVVMLETTIDVAKNFGHVFRVSAIGGLVAIAFSAWFAVTFVGVYVKFTPSPNNPACGAGGGGCSQGKVIGLLVFITFSAYWISEVIKNVMHVTVSGVYGSWYFCSRSPRGMPSRPTFGAFQRAMTYSFGSISFGSLIVSVIQLLRQACSIAQQESAMDGNFILCAVFCCLRCLLDIINWAVQYFNHYAYSYIALYGKAYVPAAKDTWKMMKDRGLDALVNDCLVDPVLTMGAVFVGYLCAFLAYLYLQFTNPAYNSTGGFTPVVMAFSFLIGLQVCNVFMVPLKSGVATIFTSMAHSPEVMIRDFPELYQRIVLVYPNIAIAVHA